MEIFKNFADPSGPLSMVIRAAHILAGITWIGLLYFFNFVQTPSFAELSDGARSEALRKLTFRALWWFRYAALLTFLFGVTLLSIEGDGKNMDKYLSGVSGTAILTGMLFGTTMFLNVWGIIWRHQKVIIASAESNRPLCPFHRSETGRFSSTVRKDLPLIRSHSFGVDGNDDALAPKFFRALAD